MSDRPSSPEQQSDQSTPERRWPWIWTDPELPPGLTEVQAIRRSDHVAMLKGVPQAQLPEHLREQLIAMARSGRHAYVRRELDDTSVVIIGRRSWPLEVWVAEQLAQGGDQ